MEIGKGIPGLDKSSDKLFKTLFLAVCVCVCGDMAAITAHMGVLPGFPRILKDEPAQLYTLIDYYIGRFAIKDKEKPGNKLWEVYSAGHICHHSAFPGTDRRKEQSPGQHKNLFERFALQTWLGT